MTATELATSGRLSGVKRCGNGYHAFCPSHDDRTHESLTFSDADDGKLLIKCHKGCDFRSICTALGLAPFDFFPHPNGNGTANARTVAVS